MNNLNLSLEELNLLIRSMDSQIDCLKYLSNRYGSEGNRYREELKKAEALRKKLNKRLESHEG